MMQQFAPSYQMCSYCVMDNSNPGVTFDDSGQCTCCRDALARKPHEWWPTVEGRARLNSTIERIKREMADRPYDVIIGLSGGVDSAYLAFIAHQELGSGALAVTAESGHP